MSPAAQAARVLLIDEPSFRIGLERATDLFALQRLRDTESAGEAAQEIFRQFGISDEQRQRLTEALREMLPLRVPEGFGSDVIESGMTVSMFAGVLVGLLIADSALPHDELPDILPENFRPKS